MKNFKFKWHHYWMRFHARESKKWWLKMPTADDVDESMEHGWIGYHETKFAYHRRKLNNTK